MRFFIRMVLAVAIGGGLGGCVHDTGSSQPLSLTHVPYSMAPLDAVVVVQPDGSRREFVVSQDGRIDLPGGSRLVKGMPVEEFRKLVGRGCPSAREIVVREFRMNRVTVLGEVFHQIHTDLSDGPMRVMDAIAAANGFTPLANKRRVRLVRQNAGTVVVYELDLREMLRGMRLDQNLLLEPGDVLTVPRNFL